MRTEAKLQETASSERAPSEAALVRISRPNLPPEAIAAVSAVLESGALVQGAQVAAFEAALGAQLGLPYVALVSSGTAALHLALLAAELPAGSGVILPNLTFPATLNAVHFAGLRPILADVCPERYVLTEESVHAALALARRGGVEVRALMPVHEFGQPVDLAQLAPLIQREGWWVIEDAACAIGAEHGASGPPVGSLGDLACFSFHPRKTLTTGEGGAVATRSAALYARVCALRSHGMRRDATGVTFERPGLNYRMTDFQAALGLAQLPKLATWVEARRRLALRYHSALAEAPLQLPALSAGHSWQSFMVTLGEGVDRAQLIAALRAEGFESNIGAQVLSELDYVAERALFDRAQLPHSIALNTRSLAIPLCERYDEEIDRCAAALLRLLKASS